MTDEHAHGITDAVQSLGEKIVTGLPAGFLFMLLINVVFVLGLLWFLHTQIGARERVLGQVIAACLQPHPR